MEENILNEVYAILNKSIFNLRLDDDDIQNIVIKVFEAYNNGQYDATKASLSTWVYNIAKNYKISSNRKEFGSRYKKEKTISFVSIDSEIDENSLSKYIDESSNEESVSILNKAIQTLNETEKDVIALYYYNNYSLHQIAEELDMAYSNVKTISFRAKNKIKLFFDKNPN
jgi:RNA polymerase sigma-70 factor (ECF subfamily)